MKNKKINVIVKYFYPVAAGIETSVLETYSLLAEKGWDVTIHTTNETLTKKNCLPAYSKYKGLMIKRYPAKWYGFIPKFNWERTDIISLHNFNIVPHLYIYIYTIWLKVLGMKKFALLITPHGGFNPPWEDYKKRTALIKRAYHDTLGVFLLNNAVDGIRAVSEWENVVIAKNGVKKNLIYTITNGAEDEAYLDSDKLASQEVKERVRGFGRYILQIGRIQQIKNYETTIKALVELPNDVKYIIAGPEGIHASYPIYLHNLIKELRLEDRVIFYGIIRGVDKYYLIKKAQMMVHMAIWESYCNVVHEGMSQGLICIVANNTALPLLIKNNVNGFVVDTYNVKTLAKKINFVLENKDSKKLQAIAERNRIYGTEHSWKKVATHVHLLYTKTYNTIITKKNMNRLTTFSLFSNSAGIQ